MCPGVHGAACATGDRCRIIPEHPYWGGEVYVAQIRYAELCEACPKCNYFSFSQALTDCSWFESCAISRLQPAVYKNARGVVEPSGHDTLQFRKPDGTLVHQELGSWQPS